MIVTVVKLATKAETPRHRRLMTGEEDVLLRHANPHLHLRAVIIGAREAGCHLGNC
jgi:hypothetical protein